MSEFASPNLIVGPGDYMAVVDSQKRQWPLDTNADTAACPGCGHVIEIPGAATIGLLEDLINEHACVDHDDLAPFDD